MLPASYQLPAAIVLLLGGTVACFFGYRMFRFVLAIFGFIFGVFASSSIVAPSDTTSMLVVGLAGGLIGAGILFAAYFVGVALFGAGLGALVANLAFSASGREPHFLVIAFCAARIPWGGLGGGRDWARAPRICVPGRAAASLISWSLRSVLWPVLPPRC